LFIYVNTASLERPEVQAFVEFYMEHGAELTAEVGYVPEDDSVYQQNFNMVAN
jgi:phosphate transport system substrate-binding protein